MEKLIKRMMSSTIAQFITQIILALFLLFIYFVIGVIIVKIIKFNDLLGVLLLLIAYFALTIWFFFLKKSESTSGVYGALEVSLGLTILVITFVQIYTDVKLFNEDNSKMYFSFYTALYIGVRGVESMYNKWKSDKENKKLGGYSNWLNNLFDKIK